MTQQVLILGGSGRIGSQVAADLLTHTAVNVTIAGRNSETGQKACQALVNSIGEMTPQRCQFVSIHLDDLRRLQDAIAQSDLVIHCAGPFHHRNASVLKLCIDSGVNYVDVSDHASFTCKAIALQAEAQAAGITLTWSVARWWHPRLLQSNSVIEFLSRVSYGMTQISDRFSGVGVAIRSEVLGTRYGQLVRCCSTLHHPNTAEVAGRGTGAIAQLLYQVRLISYDSGIYAKIGKPAFPLLPAPCPLRP